MIPKNYADPTANIAIANADRDRRTEYKKLLTVLHFIADKAGFKIVTLKLERKK